VRQVWHACAATINLARYWEAWFGSVQSPGAAMSRVVRWVSRGTVKTGRHGEDRLRVHRAISNRDEIERPTLSRLRDGKSVDVKFRESRRKSPRPYLRDIRCLMRLLFHHFAIIWWSTLNHTNNTTKWPSAVGPWARRSVVRSPVAPHQDGGPESSLVL
jgi:hypothetical protein